MRKFLLVFLCLAAGCGDDGGSPAIDAAPMDMGSMDMGAACSLPASIPNGAVGMMNMRAAGDFVRTNNGMTSFGLRIDLENAVGGAANALLITYEKPQTGFVLNQALPFETSPTGSGPVNLVLFEKLNPQAQTFTRLLAPSNGSVTFTALGEAMGTPTTATITATNFREVNSMTGADVPGGCTSTLEGLSLFLTESAAVNIHPTLEPFTVQNLQLTR